MADEEEIAMEVEAVQAVYGDECLLLDPYPPHLHLRIKPRTAEISSQQFVEAVLAIQAGPKYPNEPPIISLVDCMGLDEQRQKHLISSIQDKASELSSCLMLVEICEEAIERLTVMNHPDGDCPLCLYPLVPEGDQSKSLPFMKLMSCFHCFHRECIIRWWNWLHVEKETDVHSPNAVSSSRPRDMKNRTGMQGQAEGSSGNCPVCRKVFLAKDLEHVLDLVGAYSSQLDFNAAESDDDAKLIESDSEKIRRERFEATLKLQQEKGGLNEPKKNIAVVPGMFLPQPATSDAHKEDNTVEQEHKQECEASADANTSSSSNKPANTHRRNWNTRKQRGRGPRRPMPQWVEKPK